MHLQFNLTQFMKAIFISLRSLTSLGLLRAPCIILPLITGHVHSCTDSTFRGAYTASQPFNGSNLFVHFVISVQLGTLLHLSEVKHVRVEYVAQWHNIETTMSQRWEERKHNICLNILRQAVIERLAYAIAKRHYLENASRSSQILMVHET